jgi:uncharacterized membrane protein
VVRTGKHLWKKHPGVAGRLTPGERAADALKHWFLGTWSALGSVGLMILLWIPLQKTSLRWDIYPYVLLNLVLSCLAAVQGIILQISANRGDRIAGEVALHTQKNTDELMAINQTQLELLKEVRRLQETLGMPKGEA